MIDLREIWDAIQVKVVDLIHRTEARGCRVYRSTAQSIDSAAITPLSWDTEVYDTDGCFDPGDPTKLYARHAGYYMAGGNIVMGPADNTAASRFQLSIRKNGSSYLASNGIHTIAGKYADLSVASGMIWMEADDYIEVGFYHDEGASKNLIAASTASQIGNHGWLMRVG